MTDKYLLPECTPEECDHDGAPEGRCSKCCPCKECAAFRTHFAPEKETIND